MFYLSMIAYSQDSIRAIVKSTKIETIEGNSYYLHTVLKGQTLYSIAKAYSTDIKEIIAVNPETKDKISINQIIKIPYKKTTVAEPEKKVQNYIQHKVDGKETLYGIAKKYDTTVEAIIAENPEAKNGIKPDQILKIPTKTTTSSETPKPVTPKPEKVAETKEPTFLKEIEDKINCGEKDLSNTVNVALMVPLYLEQADKIVIDEGGEEKKFADDFKSLSFIQLYEGVMVALDSLKNSGYNIKLYVYDVGEDSSAIKQILQKAEFQKMQLMIGPVFVKPFAVAARFAKKNNIIIVSPFLASIAIDKNNKIFKPVPSMKTQIELLSEYVGQNYNNDNIVVVHNNRDKEQNAINAIKKSLGKDIKNNTFKEVVYNKQGFGGVTNALVSDKNNVLITICEDEIFVTNYVNRLNEIKDNYKLVVFGMPKWRAYDKIEIEYLQNINLNMFNSYFVNYEDSLTKGFIYKFREKYKTEPDKFAFQGFDIAYYFVTGIAKYGKNFRHCFSNIKTHSMQTRYNFMQEGEGYYENHFITIYKFSDYKLNPLNR